MPYAPNRTAGLSLAALLVATLTTAAAPARAAIQVTINPGEGQQYAQQLGIDVASIQSQLAGELERVYQVAGLKDYLESFGDAQAFTTKGLGVDYASNLKFVMIGIAANVSLNAEKGFVPDDTRAEPPIGGLSTNVSIMGGLNLGIVGASRVTLFVNYFKGEGSLDAFETELDNLGAHVKVKVLGGTDDEGLLSALVRWGGIDVTTGFDLARTRLKLEESFETRVPISARGMDVGRIDITSMGTFVVDLRTWSVPLEVTTSLRLLSLLTLYGGLGFDWQFGGGSELNVNLTGKMTGVTAAGAQTVNVGDATVTLQDEAEPSKGRLRGILGTQVNLWLLRLFVQLNWAPDPWVASVAFGGRLAW